MQLWLLMATNISKQQGYNKIYQQYYENTVYYSKAGIIVFSLQRNVI